MEFLSWYNGLLGQVRASCLRFPLWADLGDKIRVFEDRDLPGMMRLGCREPTALFDDHNKFLRLWGDDGLMEQHFDCARKGKLLKAFQPGVYYGLNHSEPLPYPVIDAVKSGRCTRLQRLAGFRQVVFYTTVNRIAFTEDVQGVRAHYDERGACFYPDLKALGDIARHNPAHLQWPKR